MRPDTPQHYEYISVEDVEGTVDNFINIKPWTQFFDLKGREDMPVSLAEHVSMKNCKCECKTFFNVVPAEDQYSLVDFTFENLEIKAENTEFAQEVIEDIKVKHVNVVAK
jgi:hypothetical protein